MKTIFLDTNVLLDFVTGRDGVEEACDILQLGEDSRVKLVTSYLTMANTAYVARKGRTKEDLYEMMIGLSQMIHVLSMDEAQLKEALTVPVSDLEDMFQYVCAKTFNCDVIITRNVKHFVFSQIPVYTPQQFIELYPTE